MPRGRSPDGAQPGAPGCTCASRVACQRVLARRGNGTPGQWRVRATARGALARQHPGCAHPPRWPKSRAHGRSVQRARPTSQRGTRALPPPVPHATGPSRPAAPASPQGVAPRVPQGARAKSHMCIRPLPWRAGVPRTPRAGRREPAVIARAFRSCSAPITQPARHATPTTIPPRAYLFDEVLLSQWPLLKRTLTLK